MRITALSLLATTLCFVITQEIIQLKQAHKYSRRQIERDPFIEVLSSSSSSIEDLHKEFLILRVIQKQRRLALSRLVQIEDKLERMLQRFEFIQDEEQLVKARIKSSINSKWSYSVVFALMGQENEVLRCYRQLSKLGVERLSNHPTINYLNEKIKTIDALNNAKVMLQRYLKKYPQMEIKSIQSIKIFGTKIENSVILQNQIRQDQTQLLNQAQLGELQSIEANMYEEGQFDMKVVFKVGLDEDFGLQDQVQSAQYQSQYTEDQYSENSQ